MGLFTTKHERRIAELEAQINALRDELAGERAIHEFEVEDRDRRIARLMESGGEWSTLPRVLYDAIGLYNTVTPSGHTYFQDALAKMPVFRMLDFKLRKQTKRNMPEGWEVEKGGIVVFCDGETIGTFSPDKVEKYGLSTSRVNRGFIVPPYRDADSGFCFNDSFVPKLLI